MALYTIGDLHLSLGRDKPMDSFGDRWQNYVEPGGVTERFNVYSQPPGPEDFNEGQPRLLVEHRRQNAALF